MSAYLVAHIDITNPEGFKAYQAAVPAIIEKFGGRYLVRGGEVDVREGDWSISRLVILEFDSKDQVKRFYDSPEYQAVLPLRLANATGDVVIVDGF